MRFLAKLLVPVCFIVLTDCSAQTEYEQRIDALTEDLRTNQLGHSQDYWLELKNAPGDWEKAALVFGYMDDYSACESIVQHARNTAPEREFRCQIS